MIFFKSLKKNNDLKLFITFLLFHFIVWSLLPFLRGVIPMDSIEAITWGKNIVFGTDKHPPLSGWFAYYFYLLLCRLPESVYILSQIFIISGFIYIYKIGKLFLSDKLSILSVIILDTIIYYNITSVEYNVNIVFLLLWPALVYHFYQAIHKNKTSDWILTGLFAALSVLDKYFVFVLFTAMFIYFCFSKEARKTLKYKGPYIALTIFIITLIPHIKWLINNDFITLTYMLKRGSSQEYFILNHLIYPLKFFFAQFILIIPLLIIFIIHKNKFNKITLNKFFSPSNDKTFFINCITFLPLIITMLGSFIGAVSLKSMWGTPMLFMTGIWLFYNFKIKTNNDTEIIFKKFIQYTYIISIIYAVTFVLIVITTPSLKFNINQDLLVNKSIDIWKTHTGNKPIIYTGGDMWIASIVAVNLERKTNQKIKTFIEMNLDKNSWVNDKILSDIKNKGIIVFANTKDEFDSYTNNFPNLKLIDIIEIKSDNIFNKSKSTKLFIGILRGEKW